MVFRAGAEKCTVRVQIGNEFHGCNQKAGHKGPHFCSHYPEGFPVGCKIVEKVAGGQPGSAAYVARGKIEPVAKA